MNLATLIRYVMSSIIVTKADTGPRPANPAQRRLVYLRHMYLKEFDLEATKSRSM